VIRFRFIRDIDPLGGEWSRLAASSSNVFGTWEWVSLWRRHFQRGRPILTTLISRESDLIAVVPLHLLPGRLIRVIRVVGHGPGDELGPVCRPADRADVARALRRALHDMPWEWDIFLGERFPADDAWSRELGGKQLRRSPSPTLQFEVTDWEEFVRSHSRDQRRHITRFERALKREHQLSYRLANDRERLNEDLDLLYALHRARWQGSSTAFGLHEKFHREFAARALELGWLRLWFMELDGTAVAAWYGFRFGGVEHAYQSGRERSLDRQSVGSVLLVHSIREALQDGIREYRFLRGGEAYKDRFANGDRGLETLGMARGVVGAGLLGAARRIDRSQIARKAFGMLLGGRAHTFASGQD
jgi:CelD/BcsL family acetyltransferase involved in cellulose biosynthesis